MGFDVVERADRGQAADRLPARGRAALRRHDAARRSSASSRRCAASHGREASARGSATRSSGRSSTRCCTQPIETLSKGFKRRVGLAQAILHDPPVLILDEPTDGLDPNQKHEVRRLIGAMARDKAIIISTHILEEVDAVCTRAVDHRPRPRRGRRHARRAEAPLALSQRGRASPSAANLAEASQALMAEPAGIAAIETIGRRQRRGQRAARVPAARRSRSSPTSATLIARQRRRGRRAAIERGQPRRRVPRPHDRRPTDAGAQLHAAVRSLDHLQARARGLFRHAARLRLHRDLPGAGRRRSRSIVGNFFERGQADLQPFFVFHPWLYLFLVPAVAMRLWAEERRSRHDRAAADPADHDFAGGARQVPRRLGLHRHRAAADLPDLDHGQLSGPARTTA